jgi:hypothetical protein
MAQAIEKIALYLLNRHGEQILSAETQMSGHRQRPD